MEQKFEGDGKGGKIIYKRKANSLAYSISLLQCIVSSYRWFNYNNYQRTSTKTTPLDLRDRKLLANYAMNYQSSNDIVRSKIMNLVG